MSLFTAGVFLIVIGGGKTLIKPKGAKLGIKTYRQIKNKQFFSQGVQEVNKQFYKGTFLQPMTRREAQLILNVREGTTPEQIKQRHRTLLLLNHPDHGGSTHLATKLNEAKEMLIK